MFVESRKGLVARVIASRSARADESDAPLGEPRDDVDLRGQLAGEWLPCVGAGWVLEAWRRDADDRVPRAVVRGDKGAANDVRIASERAAPSGVAEDDHLRLVLVAIFGPQHAPEERAHAKHLEQIGRDVRAREIERLGIQSQRARDGAEVIDAGKARCGPALSPQHVEILGRDIEMRAAAIERMHDDEPILRGDRKLLDDHRAIDGEHRRRHADAQRQKQHRGDAEPRRSQE